MASATQTMPRSLVRRTRVRNRALGVLGAVMAAVVVWLVADPVLGTDMRVTQPGRDTIEVGLGPVLVMSLLFALLGWASVAVLERLTARGTLIWTVLAVIVLALSFFPIFGVTATAGTKVALGLMHVAVAIVLIPAFWLTATRPTR